MTPGMPRVRADTAAVHRFDPIVENRASSRERGAPVRVIAFNAQGGTTFDSIVACMRKPPLSRGTFLLLSEVDSGTSRAGRRIVAADLARELGMSFAYIGEWGLCDRDGTVRSFLGNAILSREPMEQVALIPMPDPHGGRARSLPFGLRGSGLNRIGGPVAMVATVRVGGAPLRLCVAHLDSRCDPAARERQMAALLAGFPPGRAVIGGDLNTTTMSLMHPAAVTEVLRLMLLRSRRFRRPVPYEPLFGRLSEAGFEIEGANAMGVPSFTFSRIVPPWMRPRLDWIALRGLKPVPRSAAVIPARRSFFSTRISDHDFIAADLDIG